MPLTSHLRELRIRLVRSVLAIIVGTVIAAFFYDQLFDADHGAVQLRSRTSIADATLNFGGIGDPFTFALKICAMAGIFIASPVWLYQLWALRRPRACTSARSATASPSLPSACRCSSAERCWPTSSCPRASTC